MQQFPHMCTRIETIEAHIRPPSWTPTTKIRIETTKDAAKKQHDEIQTYLDAMTVTVYTDGSGIEGKIGAAAQNSVTNEANHQHLGSEAQFNVYTAELTAIHRAIKQLRDHCECRTSRIYTDSQTAIKAIYHPRRQSGQTMVSKRSAIRLASSRVRGSLSSTSVRVLGFNPRMNLSTSRSSSTSPSCIASCVSRA